jgi:hypothetical protein
MKQQWFTLTAFILLIISYQGIQAQSLIIRLDDGSENTELLSTIRKLSFSDGDLSVTFTSGSIDNYDLSEVQRLSFDIHTSAGNDLMVNSSPLHIFPNPASKTIHISGIPEQAGYLHIYRSDGAEMLVEEASSPTHVMDISSLPAGIYIITVSGYTSKFFKQ